MVVCNILSTLELSDKSFVLSQLRTLIVWLARCKINLILMVPFSCFKSLSSPANLRITTRIKTMGRFYSICRWHVVMAASRLN